MFTLIKQGRSKTSVWGENVSDDQERGVDMNVVAKLASLSLTLSLVACATATWTYDNKNYPSSAEAVEAVRHDVRRKVSAVPKKDMPIAGSVLIYTPSMHWSRQGVRAWGNATDEMIRFSATGLYYGFYAMAEAVEQRHIFKSTHIREFDQRDPLANPDYDYILWLRLDDPDSAQWMIAPGADTSATAPILTSPISDPGDRIARFLQSVEQYVGDNPL